MKAIRCVLKLIAALAVIGAAACLVVKYWETLVDLFYLAVGKIKEKKAEYCCCECSSEFEDYADADGDPVV